MSKRYSDREITTLIRGGKDDRSKGMEVLYRRYLPKFFPYIKKQIGNHEEAEDIFQDAILILIENVLDRKFKGKSALQTYLFSIVRNQCIKRAQRSQKISTISQENLTEKSAKGTPETFFLNQEMAEVIQKAIHKLNPKYQEVLSLWILRYSMQEIADQLGYSSATVARVTKSRGLKELAQIIQKDPELKRLIKEVYDQM
jgi:RNA polymerase sigma factor (sigma-70 family)